MPKLIFNKNNQSFVLPGFLRCCALFVGLVFGVDPSYASCLGPPNAIYISPVFSSPITVAAGVPAGTVVARSAMSVISPTNAIYTICNSSGGRTALVGPRSLVPGYSDVYDMGIPGFGIRTKLYTAFGALWQTVPSTQSHPNGYIGWGQTQIQMEVVKTGSVAYSGKAATGNYALMAPEDNWYSLYVSIDAGSVLAPIDVASAANSNIQTITNGQTANGSAADVLQATIRTATNHPFVNATVSFSGSPNVNLGAGVGRTKTCVTNGSGICTVNATSAVAGGYSTQASIDGVNMGSAAYSFIAGAPSNPNSTVVTQGPDQIADGISAKVLNATIRDANNNPVVGSTVNFSATSSVNFGSGVGVAGSCITNAGGTCSVNATSTVAASYSTQARIGGVDIGSGLLYSFIPGPAAGATSGVRIVTQNVFADGATPAVLEVYIRDAQNNRVSNGVAVSFSGDPDLAFNGGARGVAGSCNTTSAVCRVQVVNYNYRGGVKNSTVTAGGKELKGAFNIGATTFGSSPVSFTFEPWVPRLRIIKTVTNGSGSHTFNFTVSGTQVGTQSITVAGSGTVQGAQLLGYMPIRPITITEDRSGDWPDLSVNASCVDLNSATPAATFGNFMGSRLLIPIEKTVAGADLQCTFVNTQSLHISGRLFADTGAGGGTPNDGISNGAEPGVASVTVALTNCAAKNYGNTTTDGNGNYTLILPAGIAAETSLCVDTITASHRINTGASVATTALGLDTVVTVGGRGFTYRQEAGGLTRIMFTWPSGTENIAGLNFAGVPISTLVSKSQQVGNPGGAAVHLHTFTAGTGGTVGFSVSRSISTPALTGWSERVLVDPGCTGDVKGGAATLHAPAAAQAVVAGQAVCVFLLQSIPVQAVSGNRNEATLQARFTLTNAVPALSATYTVDDLTLVSSEVMGLLKEVRNVTGGATVFGLVNQAKPGETLEYRITYTNNGVTPINSLAINDSTPAFTSFMAATAETTPASLAGCTKLTTAATARAACSQVQAVGGRGEVSWNFVGSLLPGASGTVLFSVLVD